MKCLRLKVLLPVFSVRDFATAEVYVSYILPAPRTILSLLTRGLGELFGVSGEASGEGKCKHSELLTRAVEESTLAFVKPDSPLLRTAHMWHIKAIERRWIEDYSRLHDAVQAQIVSTNLLSIYFFVDINRLSDALRRYNYRSVDVNDLLEALWLCNRIGTTEALYAPHKEGPRTLDYGSVSGRALINTYAPESWVNIHGGSWVIEDSYFSILMLLIEDKMKGLQRKKVDFKLTRREKARLVHPLNRQVVMGKVVREIYEPATFEAEARNDFHVIRVEDGATCVLPRDELIATIMEGLLWT